MRCRHCDTKIPEDSLICPKCGKEFFVVPDYNPFEEILTQGIKNELGGGGEAIEPDEYATKLFMDTQRRMFAREEDYMGTDVMDRKTERLPLKKAAKKRPSLRRGARASRRKKGGGKWKKVLLTVFFLLILLAAVVVAAYRTYDVQIRLGEIACGAKKYGLSVMFYENARAMEPDRTEFYTGMSEALLAQGKGDEAEKLLLDAIEEHSGEISLYQAAVDYYESIDDKEKLKALFLDCQDQAVLEAFSDYQASEPEFSVTAGTYDSLKELTLEGNGTIYYTMDGSDVTEESEKYTEPIRLPEGDTLVKAFCVSAKGIQSDVITQEYTIKLPAESAPRVSPSTGQYYEETWIRIEVPDGCKAYYTLDGSVPTEDSREYTGAFRMPEGTTEFSAVVVNGNGKVSSVTRRHYELDSSDTEEEDGGEDEEDDD